MAQKFEIVHKEDILDLKKSHKELKSKLEFHEKSKLDMRIVDSIVNTVQLEAKRERELITKTLKEIKELNKSTLNHVISKTDKIEMRLEDLVEVVIELSKNIGGLHETHTKNISKQNDSNNELGELKKTLEKANKNPMDDKIIEMNKKIDEISGFMENLKLLLSQIKSPDDLKNLK